MLKPDVNEIAKLLKEESDRNGGSLPELYRIAWQAYLHEDVIDHNDYIELRDCGYFPAFEDDPEIANPVLAMAIGKHNKRNPNIPKGGFIHQTKLEELVNDIEDELAHFGGCLPPGYTVALSGRLLGLRDCEEITDTEYEQLLAMLPVLDDNPVKSVEEFTRRYANASS